MKERPIIFNSDMVRAILDGRKTQTRRVIKPQPDGVAQTGQPWVKRAIERVCPDSRSIIKTDRTRDGKQIVRSIDSPFGHPGGRLWVRETHSLSLKDDAHRLPLHEAYQVYYKADNDRPTWAERRWSPSIHMPRWASRIELEVVTIRVERVQAIGDNDAVDEGIRFHEGYFCGARHKNKGTPKCYSDAPSAFADLWDSINAARGYGWGTNPWVWVVGFKVITPPVAA